MPYFITQTKAGVNLKKLKLTIQPREHREVHGSKVFPKKDAEVGGGLHVYFNEHGAYWLPEATDDSGRSIYLGGQLDDEQMAEWLSKLRAVATWLTPEKAQHIYDWLTDPLPNPDGTEKSLAQRKHREGDNFNEAFAMTNGYQINLGDADGHWKLRGSIKAIQSMTSVRVGEDLAKSHAEQKASFEAAEAEAANAPAPMPEPDPIDECPPDELPSEIKPVYVVPEPKSDPKSQPVPKRRGRPMGRKNKG